MTPVTGSLIRALLLVLLAVVVAPSAQAQNSGPRFTQEGDVVTALAGDDARLDLDDCVEIALRANPALLQEREGLRGLDALKIQARSEGFPRVEVQGAWSRGRDPSFALDESFGGGDSGPLVLEGLIDGTTPFSLEFPAFIPAPADVAPQTFWRTYLDGYWELRPTRLLRAVSAASGAIDQQHARILDVEHRTIERVIGAYHSVVLAHERIAAMTREIEAREEFLAITRRRFRLDFATPLDTLQAAVSLANLQPERRRRANDLRRAGQSLNLLLGRDPLTPVAVVATFPLETEVLQAEVALRLARAWRPDLEAQRRQSDLYELQRGIARAQNHPYLTIEGQWGYVTRDLDGLTDDGHDFWRAGVTFHLPIFDGLLSKGQQREAEASLRRNEMLVGELQSQMRDEVLGALDELEIARADLAAAVLNLRGADDAYTQISLRYELGKSSNLDALNAQSERFTARSTLIEARYQVLTSLATLKRAIGMSPAAPLATLLTDAARTDEEISR